MTNHIVGHVGYGGRGRNATLDDPAPHGAARVILIHGLLGSAEEWRPVVEALAPVPSVAVDLRAHGTKVALTTGLTVEQLADDAAAEIRRVATAPVVVVGQSMGGVVAFATASRYPECVAHLVLIESGIGAGGEVALAKVSAEIDQFPDLMDDTNHAAARADDPTGIVAASYVRAAHGWRRRWDAAAMKAIMASVFADDRRAAWRALAVPATIVVAEESAIDHVELAGLRDERPDTHWLRVPRAGHDIHGDRPDVVARIIAELLECRNVD